MLAPSACRAACNSPIGRVRNGGSPSIVIGVSASAATAVMKRDVVPAKRASTCPVLGRIRPSLPVTTTTPSSTAPTSTPRSARQRSIAVVSSPSGTFVNRLTPRARAAATSARLAMLFDPGTVTSPYTGPAAARRRFTRAATRPDAALGRRARRDTARPRRRRRGRRRHRGCSRRGGRPRSWRC